MTNSKRRTLPAVVAGALGIGAFAAFAGAQNTTTDLQRQVDELQAKVSSMEAARAPRTAEVNATIDSVLADAETHSKLLAAMGPGAGHDADGFFIRGDQFELRPSLGMQFRYDLDWQNKGKRGTENNTTTGFEVTRMRLMFSGFAADPKLTYFFQWDMGDISGGTGLLDAVVKYQFADNVAIKAGQFIVPVYHEELNSDFRQLTVDRSLVDALIGANQARVQGVSAVIGAPADKFHAEITFHDGIGSANTSFVDNGVSWGVAGRVEVLVQGDWIDYGGMSARGAKQNLIVIGAGGDITEGDNFRTYRFTADAALAMDKLSAYGAFLGLVTDNRNTGLNNTFDWGFVVQAGYAINDQLEPFARFDWTHFETTQANGKRNAYEITGGVNYYLNSAAKISVDLSWLPSGSPAGAAYQDIIGGTRKSEILARAQFQLVL